VVISRLLVLLVRRQRHIARLRLNSKTEADGKKAGSCWMENEGITPACSVQSKGEFECDGE